MTSATSKKIPLAAITISGPDGKLKTTHSWAEADGLLAAWFSLSPGTHPVIKHRYSVLWADGFKVNGSYGGMPKTTKPDIAASIERLWQYYAGFWKPENQTPDDYDKKIAEDPKRRDEATKALTTYALDDLPSDAAVTEKILATNPVTIDDLELTQQFIGRMVRGVEETQPVNRAVAMELRKALAAIIRACGMLAAEQIDAKRNAEQ